MSVQYPEPSQHKQQQKIQYWERTTIEKAYSIPQDYYEQMRQRLGTEFQQTFVDKGTCTKVCGAVLYQIETMKKQMDMLNERLDILEHPSQVEGEPLQLIIIPEEEATAKILSFINSHPGARTSEIICDLGLDPDLALRILRKLQEEERIKGKDIERV